jgi:RimJ/RimL family protein N-acetyltransferase
VQFWRNDVNSSKISIRELGPSDASAFWSLRLRGLQEEPHAFSRSYEESKDVPISDIEKRLLVNNDQFVLGVFDDDKLIGVTGFLRYNGEKVAHKGEMWGVYLLSEYRGQGVAKKLLLAVIEKARALPGVELIHLGVNPANKPVVGLYESVGFTKWGEEVHALKVNGEYVDEDQMVLFF